MDARLYYTAPSDECFEDMRQAALKVWEQYKDEPDYYEEKTAKIKGIKNVTDNFMYMFAMFDHLNQMKCVNLLQEGTKEALKARMIDGGNNLSHIEMLGL